MNNDVHTDMIRSAIEYYRGNNYTGIRADHLNSQNPPDEIDGNIPDITCFVGNVPCISEIETADSYNTQQTLEQLQSLSRSSRKIGGQFHMVVPTSVLSQAKAFASKNGIAVDLWLQNNRY